MQQRNHQTGCVQSQAQGSDMGLCPQCCRSIDSIPQISLANSVFPRREWPVENPSIGSTCHPTKRCCKGSNNYKTICSDEPNKGLGFHLTPTGSQTNEFEAVKASIIKVCNVITGCNITAHVAALCLCQQVIPKLQYPLHLSSFSDKQCWQLNTIITSTFPPQMQVNQKMPQAVVFGTAHMGGLAFPLTSLLHAQTSRTYFIHTLQRDALLAQDIRHTLNVLQLTSEFDTPVMEADTLPAPFVDAGWLTSIKDCLDLINASIWIEDVWHPHLQ